MSVLPACMYVCHMHAFWKSEEGVRSPGTWVPDDCEPPWGCWKLNPGPLQ